MARRLMREVQPVDDLFPSRHLPKLRARAEQRYAEVLAEFGAEQGGVAR